MKSHRTVLKLVPLVASSALVLAACGGDGDSTPVAQQPASEAAGPAGGEQTDAPAATADAPAKAVSRTADQTAAATGGKAADAGSSGDARKATRADRTASTTKDEAGTKSVATEPSKPGAATKAKGTMGSDITVIKGGESAAQKAENQKIYEAKNGVTDVGVSKESIRLGSVNMHDMALGNIVTAPVVRGNLATAGAINDRGGVLGRRLSIVDCDDGPGEVSRAKACIKKLVAQDKVFSLVTGIDWATASIHDDLKQHKLPYIGAWA